MAETYLVPVDFSTCPGKIKNLASVTSPAKMHMLTCSFPV